MNTKENFMKLELRDMILAGLFTALMIVGAFLKIPTPFGIVVTFQLFFAIFAGLLLKPMAALMSQIVYILLGLFIIPVFAYGGGIQYVTNPTFGYIIGFAFTALIISFLVAREKKVVFHRIFIIAIIGYSATYLIGNLYFYMVKGVFGGDALSLLGVFGIMSSFMIKDFVLLVFAAYSATIIIPVLRQNGYITAYSMR